MSWASGDRKPFADEDGTEQECADLQELPASQRATWPPRVGAKYSPPLRFRTCFGSTQECALARCLRWHIEICSFSIYRTLNGKKIRALCQSRGRRRATVFPRVTDFALPILVSSANSTYEETSLDRLGSRWGAGACRMATWSPDPVWGKPSV